MLFAIIFMWTPPHFWALALFKSGDYARAGIPMLPNVTGADRHPAPNPRLFAAARAARRFAVRARLCLGALRHAGLRSRRAVRLRWHGASIGNARATAAEQSRKAALRLLDPLSLPLHWRCSSPSRARSRVCRRIMSFLVDQQPVRRDVALTPATAEAPARTQYRASGSTCGLFVLLFYVVTIVKLGPRRSCTARCEA